MAKKYSNVSDIPLSVAVWLAASHYDLEEKPEKALSATDLNKSVRQYILAHRAAATGSIAAVDISGTIKSKFGSAIHEGIELSWLDKEKRDNALRDLGYPQRVIDRIVVNPSVLGDDEIPIYMEIRDSIIIDGWTISGKFDCVFDGVLEDFKSTGTFSYGTVNDWKYISQGSIYKLIHKDIITSDHMHIIWLFTDWSGAKAMKDKSYPPKSICVHRLELKSEVETTQMIRDFIHSIEANWNVPEEDLPPCEDHHLWRSDPAYKVYKDANAKRAMSGGTFDNFYNASAFQAQKGGIIKTIHSEPKACKWCAAAHLCSQRKQFIADGSLKA